MSPATTVHGSKPQTICARRTRATWHRHQPRIRVCPHRVRSSRACPVYSEPVATEHMLGCKVLHLDHATGSIKVERIIFVRAYTDLRVDPQCVDKFGPRYFPPVVLVHDVEHGLKSVWR